MEAKDRILPDWKLIDMAETLYNFHMAMDIEGIKNTLWQLAKQQDNVSFPKGEKQGIKKVVEWIDETAIMGYKENELGIKPPTDLVVDLSSWQAFKQEMPK
ncbi:MAG TPA: hypothetical protein VMW45_04345 [Dehalococcoidia bacterium]|nr:hypothetical protein [Dehalococcoidia bacterium]